MYREVLDPWWLKSLCIFRALAGLVGESRLASERSRVSMSNRRLKRFRCGWSPKLPGLTGTDPEVTSEVGEGFISLLTHEFSCKRWLAHSGIALKDLSGYSIRNPPQLADREPLEVSQKFGFLGRLPRASRQALVIPAVALRGHSPPERASGRAPLHADARCFVFARSRRTFRFSDLQPPSESSHRFFCYRSAAGDLPFWVVIGLLKDAWDLLFQGGTPALRKSFSQYFRLDDCLKSFRGTIRWVECFSLSCELNSQASTEPVA
jgi:hypothetical protein